MPASGNVATVDALNSLLEAEAGSIFNVVESAAPYFASAEPAVRDPLRKMIESGRARSRELARLVESLGGEPARLGRTRGSDEQYLSYLTMRFLVPKLAEAKHVLIVRYENALDALDGAAPPETRQKMTQMLDEHRSDLRALRSTLSGKRTASSETSAAQAGGTRQN